MNPYFRPHSTTRQFQVPSETATQLPETAQGWSSDNPRPTDPVGKPNAVWLAGLSFRHVKMPWPCHVQGWFSAFRAHRMPCGSRSTCNHMDDQTQRIECQVVETAHNSLARPMSSRRGWSSRQTPCYMFPGSRSWAFACEPMERGTLCIRSQVVYSTRIKTSDVHVTPLREFSCHHQGIKKEHHPPQTDLGLGFISSLIVRSRDLQLRHQPIAGSAVRYLSAHASGDLRARL